MRIRRSFSKEMKLSLLRELESKSAAEVCRENNVHPTLLNRWKKEYEKSPNEAFSGKGKIWKEESIIAKCERKIGQQAMEIDFLKKTLDILQERRAEEKKRWSQ